MEHKNFDIDRFIEILEREIDYQVNRGFDYVFSISVSDAKQLLKILKRLKYGPSKEI